MLFPPILQHQLLCLKLEGNVRICFPCSFHCADVILPEVQPLPLALSLSPVKWDPFPALSALLSLSPLRFHPLGSAEPFSWLRAAAEPGARVLPAGAASSPAPGAGHPDSRQTGPGAAACCHSDSRRAPSVRFAVICHRTGLGAAPAGAAAAGGRRERCQRCPRVLK